MKRAIGKCWRESASLIVLAKRNVDVSSSRNAGGSNYDILLQTRTHNASFSNGVVFPGGVSEEADASEHWLHLLSSFGFGQNDFEALHRSRALASPIFASNPIRRHIALRISAIRETFEELGLLICSSKHKADRSGKWADVLADVDVKYWQSRVSKDPAELFNLCKQYSCYPDIWALHYWSNWLTPSKARVRFDTAFFVTALKEQPTGIQANSEVVKAEWETPLNILARNSRKEVQLYPPQGYEFHRLSKFNDIEELVQFAKEISCKGNELFYPVHVQAKDGAIHLLPGDYSYPSNVDLDDVSVLKEEKTILELRDTKQTLHRFEISKEEVVLVTQNYTPKNHITMDNQVVPLNVVTIH
ncbi:acyl-coenzyme A diphosphatase NUDT19-like [Maniola jurtina]|uniref:acyl-coenzyme A diphosphatase NUDT19-like n=1 Tax=Maniola jurtina TaxID=191418 RepID=UPI001E68EBE0|nr:acyl-coenzyme A diphosphatase NUDT19-like [Maniola jurtina]